MQLTFGDIDYSARLKRTRRQKFLDQMERTVPWAKLTAVIEPHYPKGGCGQEPYPLAVMLRVHLMQNWFGLSDPAMEEALYENTVIRHFAGLASRDALPDESTILRFRHLLEKHDLAPRLFETINHHLETQGLLVRTGTLVDATIIHAPSSTKNKARQRDPDMHSTKKGNQWYFGMKAHIGVDAHSGLVHTVTTTAANVADVTQTVRLLHGEETCVFADAGYTGITQREEIANDETKNRLEWFVADKRSRVQAIEDISLKAAVKDLEHAKASIRAKVEHPFRVIKCQFGYIKTRFKGLAKNTVQIITLFALSNLWMTRKALLAKTG